MHLARDLLDNQMIDRNGHKIGKLDDIVLVERRGRPPRVSAIEIGLAPALARIHERLRWGGCVRIDIDRITKAGINVQADIDANRTQIYAWERWIGRVFVGRIPGHGGGGPEDEKK